MIEDPVRLNAGSVLTFFSVMQTSFVEVQGLVSLAVDCIVVIPGHNR